MLIPRFSIRFLMGLTTLLAAACLVASHALRGEPWAIGLFAVLVMLAIQFMTFGIVFGFAFAISRRWGGKKVECSEGAESQIGVLPAWGGSSEEE